MPSILIALSMLMASLGTAPARLSVEITQLTQAGGTLRVALYKPGAKFGKTPPDFYKNIPIIQPGSQTAIFEVPPGEYAVAVYHDLNDNNKMDRNLIGYPKEPFGFSNNYRPTVAAPDFEDCAFQLTEKGTSISIKLIN